MWKNLIMSYPEASGEKVDSGNAVGKNLIRNVRIVEVFHDCT
jgi:hypothetical protein